MANYTAADVKKLRDFTGAGMMDSKNALEESNGDFDKAVEVLRIKGAKDVGKRADRESSEGLIVASNGTMLELNSETDFVAKNAEFITLGNELLELANEESIFELENLLNSEIKGVKVSDYIQQFAAKIGEKIKLNALTHLDGKIATYLHKRATDLPPAVGSMVSYTGESDTSESVAKQVAMQIVAMNAQYLSREEVPNDLVETEKRVAIETAKSEGKPDSIIEKIAEGRLNTYYKSVVLLEQASVADPKKTVADLVKLAGIELKDFKRFELGK